MWWYLWLFYWFGFFMLFELIFKTYTIYGEDITDPARKNLYAAIGTGMCFLWPVTIWFIIHEYFRQK